MADIPAIIEGASEGKGLGTRFLRHIERNAVLLLMVSAYTPDIGNTYEMLVNELKVHNLELLDKPRLLVISKMDLLEDEEAKAEITAQLPKKLDHVWISAITGQGIPQLKDKVWGLLGKG